MKNSRLLFTVMFMLGVTVAFAQDMDRKEWDPEKMSEREIERVGEAIPDLSEDQKVKLKEASVEHFEQMKAFREENKEEREARKEKMQGFHEAKLATYKEVLSREQYVKLLEHMVTHPRHDGPRGHRGGHPHKGRHGDRNNK
ncbi:hypothetical protein GCM10009122_19140 [Fulvivirga kasyanovii]|uniref:DUF4890 domain-containing protein n=1 Tax=Fulvivirga kasyanovii TaxID=396812 RepID=A0ABW9RLY7_9BACT|nr:hypothetical protein [Fulvivirga kasyanovii]MTI24200.1 hypothetical protein [Fulvivirga kasyanovii]